MCDTEGRWDRIASHRDSLLVIARRRTLSAADAEDVVQEAMARAAQKRDLDLDNAGAWLTRVVINLCIDIQRRRARTLPIEHIAATAWTRGHEERVCDQEEARWVAAQTALLPPKQRAALLLRASGRSVDELARELGVTRSAGEAALKRARVALRGKLAATYSAVGVVVGVVNPRRSHATALAVVATSATCFVASPSHAGEHAGVVATVPGVRSRNVVDLPRTITSSSREASSSRTISLRENAERLLRPQPDYVVKPVSARTTVAGMHGGGVTASHQQDGPVDSVRWCLATMTITPRHIGCRN